MEQISNVVKVTLPNYLAQLPLPDSVAGIFHLSVTDWLRLVPLFGTVSFLSWATFKSFFPQRGKVNFKIDQESSKVVHAFDIEDLGNKTVLCRCWRSQKFPYCDGSHVGHNLQTGDNVGPLLVKRKE